MNEKEKNTIEQNESKLKEMILLISELSEGDEFFGSTKLNKLLFFSDFLAFQLYGKPISGFTYEARPEGPMLKGFYQIRDNLERSGEIVVREKNFWNFSQHRTIALRNADASKFSSEEFLIIMRVLNQYRDMSAAQISAKSHDFIGWQIVDIGEEIPYHTALVSTRDLTLEEWEYPGTQELQLEEMGIEASTLVK